MSSLFTEINEIIQLVKFQSARYRAGQIGCIYYRKLMRTYGAMIAVLMRE